MRLSGAYTKFDSDDNLNSGRYYFNVLKHFRIFGKFWEMIKFSIDTNNSCT